MTQLSPRLLRVAVTAVLAVSLLALSSCSTDATTDGAGRRNRQAPTSPEVVLDLSGSTGTLLQTDGLLGLAFSADGRRLLVLRTLRDRSIRLGSFPYRPGTSMSAGEESVLVEYPHPFLHNGGGLAVDENGDVLVGLGAVVIAGAEPSEWQTPDGVVIRVPHRAVERPGAEPVRPSTNNLVARGLRNPWQISVDGDRRRLWIADVGETAREELNAVSLDRAPGEPIPNLGWPYREGTIPFRPPSFSGAASTLSITPPEGTVLTDPVWDYERSDDSCAIIGGFHYRGRRLAWLRDRYLFSDYCGRDLRALSTSDPKPEVEHLTDPLDEAPTDFAEAPDGEVFVLGNEGTVYRLEPDRTRTRGVLWRRVGSFWGDGSDRNRAAGLESSALTVTPDGSELLVANRDGRIARLQVEPTGSPYGGRRDRSERSRVGTTTTTTAPPAPPAVCAIGSAIDNLFFRPKSTAEDARIAWQRAADTLAAARTELDDTLVGPVGTLEQLILRLGAVAGANGWNPESAWAGEVVAGLLAERGTFALVASTVSQVAALLDQRCDDV